MFQSTLLTSFLLLTAVGAFALDPTEESQLKLVYKLGEMELKPNEEVILNVPPQFQKLPLDFAFITHKQNPKSERECRSQSDGSKIVDCLPAYTSFEVKDSQSPRADEDWRFWGGSGSGPFNSKFAEVRSGQGETDNLYEWRKKGHYSVVTNSHSKNALIPSAFRVRSVGRDSLILQEVVIKFLPPPPTFMEEVIFSKGFRFGDYETAEGRKYPGRASVGNYGDSLSMTKRRTPRHANFPSHWIISRGQILIPTQPGKRLLFIDIAVGDMKPVPQGADAEQYRGGAKVLVKLDSEVLADAENVGTNGVMRSSPKVLLRQTNSDPHYVTIQVPAGTAQIMGIRLGYDEN